ncbi:MAG: hypothetical protein KY455_02385 [Euryarchaeota archaeon]|nr:hypothetical protein [Euryarchaeota archaeon]
MDGEEGFTYASLRRLERTENTSPRLTKLEGRFWERLGDHLGRLRSAFQDQQEEDPTSRRTVVLADELRNTLRLAESIWSLREKKVVQAALAAARKSEGPPHPPEHTLPEERSLYEEVLAVLKERRGDVLLQVRPGARPKPVPDAEKEKPEAAQVGAGMAGAGAARPAETPFATAAPAETGRTHATGRPGARQVPAGPPGPEREEAPQEAQAPPHQGRGGVGSARQEEVELRLVEALEDVPLFAGPDLVDYRMSKGEIGNLPRRAAEILAQQGRVRILPEGTSPPRQEAPPTPKAP